jgi:predicted nucleic acid-binding protein
MLDSQVLVHMHKGRRGSESGFTIASVSAQEFLLSYGLDPKHPSYYLPLRMGPYHAYPIYRDRSASQKLASMRRRTDKLIIDFNGQYPAIVEYGSRAFASAINLGNAKVFYEAMEILPKVDQRSLKDRFDFLVESGVRCQALEQQTIEIGLDLLAELIFIGESAPKANFRNTVCDLMILATAIKHKCELITEDKLLSRTAAKRYRAPARWRRNEC